MHFLSDNWFHKATGNAMIEHDWWEGPQYEAGINGQKIAIIGHSHHSAEDDTPDTDTNTGTVDCIRKVISGEWSFSFFSSIRNYLGYERHSDLWNRVIFMNFLPERVSGIHDPGTEEQIERGRTRFLRMLAERKPDKVLVFTIKGWVILPPSVETGPDNLDGELPLSGAFAQFRRCTYRVDDHIISAFGLRHPLYAPSDVMKRAVQHIMALPKGA
jgi:hypothetical protein